jgi:hypothetical protein
LESHECNVGQKRKWAGENNFRFWPIKLYFSIGQKLRKNRRSETNTKPAIRWAVITAGFGNGIKVDGFFFRPQAAPPLRYHDYSWGELANLLREAGYAIRDACDDYERLPQPS